MGLLCHSRLLPQGFGSARIVPPSPLQSWQCCFCWLGSSVFADIGTISTVTRCPWTCCECEVVVFGVGSIQLANLMFCFSHCSSWAQCLPQFPYTTGPSELSLRTLHGVVRMRRSLDRSSGVALS